MVNENIVVGTIRNKPLTHFMVVFLTTVIVLAGLIASLVVYYSTSFTSRRDFFYSQTDVLYIPSLYHDIVTGSDLSDWRLSAASFFFPDMLLYFFARSATPHMFMALSTYGILQYLLFALGLLFLTKKCLPRAYGTARYTLIALMSIVFAYSMDTLHEINHLMFTSVHHFGVVVTIPWVLALSHSLIGQPRLKAFPLLALCLLSFLTSVSDALYLIQVTAPLCGCLFILFLIKKINLKQALSINAVLIFASLAGLELSRLLMWKYPTLQSYFALSLMDESYANFVESIGLALLTTPYHTVLAVFFLCACIVIIVKKIGIPLLRHSTATVDLTEVMFPLYFLAATAINVLTVVSSGIFLNAKTFRYFLPFFIFSGWWGMPFIFRLPKIIKPVLFERAVLGIVALVVVFSLGTVNIQQMIENTTAIYYPSFIKCLDENTARLGVKNGIAQYWQAKPISMLTQASLKVVQVNRDLSPMHWINNLAWYEIEPEFAIIDLSLSAEHDFRLDEALIISRYGEPDVTFQCDHSKVLVYQDAHSQFRTLFKNTLPTYKNLRRPPWRLWFVAHKTDVNFGDRFNLKGYDLRIDNSASKIVVTFYWQRLQALDFNYSVFVHLIDESDQLVSQDDHAPGERQNYPPIVWSSEDIIADSRELTIPAQSLSSAYRLRIGVYNWITGERLPVFSDGASTGDFVILDPFSKQ